MDPKLKSDLILNLLKAFNDNHEIYKNFLTGIFCGDFKYLQSVLGNPEITAKFLASNFYNNITKIPEKIYLTTDTFKQKCYACIFGAFYGDSRGSYCEFSEANEKNHQLIYKNENIFGCLKGSITDDSEMAMSMAYALMENPNLSMINSAYNYFFYVLWYYSGPSDIGNTVSNALRRYDYHKKEFILDDEKSFQKVYRAYEKLNENSKSNGWLMRFSPFIVWYAFRKKEIIDANLVKDTEKLYILYSNIKEDCIKDINCTHSNSEIPSCAAIFTIMGLAAIRSYPPNEIIEILNILLKKENFNVKRKEHKNDYYGGFLFIESLKEISDKNFDKKHYFTQYKSCYDSMGLYDHAIRLTLHFLIHFNEYKCDKTIEKIFDEVCDYGGDTDTNAAIVGTILGPVVGMENFGNEFQDCIGAINQNRLIFSSPLMYYFVESFENNNKKNGEKFYLMKLLLEMML